MFKWKIESKSNRAWNHEGQAVKIADAVKGIKLAFDKCKKENGDIPNDLNWGMLPPDENEDNNLLKSGQ